MKDRFKMYKENSCRAIFLFEMFAVSIQCFRGCVLHRKLKICLLSKGNFNNDSFSVNIIAVKFYKHRRKFVSDQIENVSIRNCEISFEVLEFEVII